MIVENFNNIVDFTKAQENYFASHLNTELANGHHYSVVQSEYYLSVGQYM